MQQPVLASINIADYTYHLPDERIAKFPLNERDQSNLLVYRNGTISVDVFSNLPDYIGSSNMLVFNNTRVLRARIEMEKETGAHIEIFCLEPSDNYQTAFEQRRTCLWNCMVGNLKKWKSGTLQKRFIASDGSEVMLQAERIAETPQCQIIRFTWDNGLDFGTLLETCGSMPVPPYLNRKAETIDNTRYQTVYSKHRGSVAAPTAGLHFTPHVLQRLSNNNVLLNEITLHVGAGTFRPVQQNDARLHEMHVEHFSIQLDVIRSLIANKGMTIAVGTTSLRTLESVYWLGVKLLKNNAMLQNLFVDQWEAYTLPQDVSVEESLTCICNALERNRMNTLVASTKIMIVPGYKFKICKQLLTNFHQPQSTLLLLVSAFVGKQWKNIYQYAMEHNFRFLSYGDSSLLELHL